MRSIVQSSGDPVIDRRFAYAEACAAEGDRQAAAEILGQIVADAPGWAAGWFRLGEIRATLGETAAAAAAFERAAGLDPEDRLGAGVALAALGSAAPAAMNPAFVRGLFDQYAGRFDVHLVGELGYRGPDVLYVAVETACAARGRPFFFDRCLDLGCGTGLAGKRFWKRVDSMNGVDLSPAMIEAARATGVYAHLACGDLVAWLEGEASADLVLAADVFVYVGDLAPTFAAVARALEPGGLFAFTVQTGPETGYRIGPDRRFAHSEAYIRNALADCNLAVVSLEPVSTRRDAGRDVPGVVAVATPASP
jgi:predicted TPR repeat methyltransferase